MEPLLLSPDRRSLAEPGLGVPQRNERANLSGATHLNNGIPPLRPGNGEGSIGQLNAVPPNPNADNNYNVGNERDEGTEYYLEALIQHL